MKKTISILILIAGLLYNSYSSKANCILCAPCGANGSQTNCTTVMGVSCNQIHYPTWVTCTNFLPLSNQNYTTSSAILIATPGSTLIFTIIDNQAMYLATADTILPEAQIPTINPFPNPSYDDVRFDLTTLNDLAAYATISIYDATGKIVTVLNDVKSNQLYFARGANGAGTYYYDVKVADQIVYQGQMWLN